MRQTAYAKINLALHVRRRRGDGYHEIETLFAFIDAGDVLTARRSERDELRVVGEFAHEIADPFGNLVSKALARVPRPDGLSIVLEKNLPVAAGLGGGSADAGAVFRLVREAHGLPEDWRQRAASLGADVPACVESVACLGRGTGTELEPVENDLAGLPVLLLNPRIAMPTGPVFAAWDGVDRGPLPQGTVEQITYGARNDLELPAVGLCRVIADVLEGLNDTDPLRSGMSGSGATCYAIYRTEAQRDRAAEIFAREDPGWWRMIGSLR